VFNAEARLETKDLRKSRVIELGVNRRSLRCRRRRRRRRHVIMKMEKEEVALLVEVKGVRCLWKSEVGALADPLGNRTIEKRRLQVSDLQ